MTPPTASAPFLWLLVAVAALVRSLPLIPGLIHKNNNRYWSNHHAYTQNIRPSTQDNHENSHNHSELNDLLAFLDCGIDSVSSSSTFLELELEPEGRKYDRNSDRKSAIPERVCTPTYLLFIINLLLLLLLITKWRIEEKRSSFDGETTTGANTALTCTTVYSHKIKYISDMGVNYNAYYYYF